MAEYKERHGLVFPSGMPDPLIDLKIWKHWREPNYAACTHKEPWELFWGAIHAIVPKREFVRHEWSEQHVYDWTTEKFIIVWGAAASGKSNDYGLMTLIDWMVDPAQTVSILASTSVTMLKLRSYESVLRYFHLVQKAAPWRMPGKLRKTDDAIILDSDDPTGTSTDKASIRGVAVAEGSDTEARAKLQGAHLPYVRLVLDELSQMRPAAMKVRTNLSVGATDFKLVGLCNPDSFTDLAARYSVPVVDGGFSTLDPETSFEWRSRYGKVRRHDGVRSPAITHPDPKVRESLGFLMTRDRLNEILTEFEGNEDDPEVWTMVRGFPPRQGRRPSLISMAEILQCGATTGVTWRFGPSVTVLGVDPAFSEGGNRAVMQALDIGADENDQVMLSFREPRVIRIDASGDKPVLAQVGDAVRDYAAELSIPGELIGMDDSATQSVADFMAHEYHLHVRRFVSNNKASVMPMSTRDRLRACDRFANQATELWAATAAFIRSRQIHNLPPNAAEQLSERPTEPGKRPLRLQSKKTTRREGNESAFDSPDDMDAVSYAVGVARFFLQMTAGSSRIPGKLVLPGSRGFQRDTMRLAAMRHDLDSRAYEGAGIG